MISSVWSWLPPEAQAEVLSTLRSEARTSSLLAQVGELLEEHGKRVPLIEPARWHALRSQWFKAAAAELSDAEPTEEGSSK